MGLFSKLNETVNQFDPTAKNRTSQNYNSSYNNGYNYNTYEYAQPTPTPAYQTYRPYPAPQNNGYSSQSPQSLPQQYSSPWVAQWDPTSRNYYYVNRMTGERRWNNPDMPASRDMSQGAPMATASVAAPMAVDPNANRVGQTGSANTMDSMGMGQGAGIGDVAEMGLAVVDGFGGLVDTTEEVTGNDGKDDDGSDSDDDGGLWSKIKNVVKDVFDSDSDDD